MSTKRKAKIATWFGDILECINIIQQYTAGQTIESYLATDIMRDAVERRLQIITEASARLGAQGPLLCPTIDWDEVREYGNFLRHEYQHVTTHDTWDIVINELPDLKDAVRGALQSLKDDPDNPQ